MNRESTGIPIVGARAGDARKHRVGPSNNNPSVVRIPGTADITLVSMNLLYLRYSNRVDQEMQPPLGVLYLVAALEQNGFAVDLVDYQVFPRMHPEADPFDLDSALAFLGDTADIVGFSCMANLLPFTLLLAEELWRRHPGTTILLGGTGPSGVEEAILERFPWISAILRGESEVSLPLALEALKRHGTFDGVPGVFCRKSDGKPRFSRTQSRITDLDSLPMPAYHRIRMEEYDAYGIITSRGCPYGCRFCSVAPVWDRRTTYRSMDSILSEIRLLNERYGITQVLLQDEYFYSSEERVLEFCDRLLAEGPHIEWKCYGRVNLVSEKAMRRMADAGCVQLRFGIESGSDNVLKQVVKGFTYAEAARALQQARSIFRSVEAFFIWGFPFECMDDFLLTTLRMTHLRNQGITVLPSLLSMLPRTDIYSDYRKGTYGGKLSLVPELVPIYVVTGHEVLGSSNIVPDRYRLFYDFIAGNEDVFPGFFLFDFDNNIKPKYAVMQQLEFV